MTFQDHQRFCVESQDEGGGSKPFNGFVRQFRLYKFVNAISHSVFRRSRWFYGSNNLLHVKVAALACSELVNVKSPFGAKVIGVSLNESFSKTSKREYRKP